MSEGLTRRNIKIAAASSDGVNVDVHLGQAAQFTVLEVNGHGEILARFSLPGLSGNHDPQSLARFDGVSYILATRIGPRMAREFEKRNITVFDIEGSIEDAVRKIIRYENNKNRKLGDKDICLINFGK
jgi:predicted Fe-Mo cluster-binding NifX family protein